MDMLVTDYRSVTRDESNTSNYRTCKPVLSASIASIIFEGIVNRERVPNERLSFRRAFSIQPSVYFNANLDIYEPAELPPSFRRFKNPTEHR